ncbi:oligosaccharide flippase family protein [Flavobacterium sp.]|jgi:O-antigen/teichoic acid export membrane protein|uniref:oligosaccharide flippase family protein n=1 Tax=Flavobacterium sp. TaxID=239 RepID=UPI0037C05335
MIGRYLKKYSSNRTQKTNLNTFLSLFFRGASIFLSFILVPLTINYIKPDIYGVWLTLSSLVGWIAMLDIGISNGLKNKLSESLAAKNYAQGKMYVSTTYVIIGLIAIGLVCIYLIFHQLVNWQSVFNSPFIPENILRNMVSIVAILFLLKFVADIINVVAAAFQMVAVSSFLLFLSNLGITLSVWILTKTTAPNVVLLAICLSLIPFLISVISSLFLFNTSFKNVKPSFEKVNFKQSRGILSLGWQFFVLQIVVVIIFQTDNIIIAQFFEPKEVTNFNVAYKYYSILAIVFSIVLTPYWTAFNEAYFKNEISWIKSSIQKLIKFFLASILASVLMIAVSASFFRMWVGDEVKISISLSVWLCLYIAIMNWSSIFSNFLNGIGKIRLQMIFAPLVGVINIFLSIFFIKVLHLDIISIPLANSLSLSFGAFLGFFQYKKIINNKAKGIWNK